jgi:nicotinamide phosphoribosyltransferase
MFKVSPLFQADGYKGGHPLMQHPDTDMIYNNYTCRRSRHKNIQKTVFFGLQYFIKEYLINQWNKNFFNKSKDEVVRKYKRRMKNYLEIQDFPTKHIEDLHDLGYLPIEIKALPEGTLVPMGVPCFTTESTLKDKRYSWLPQYIETIASTSL